jgi:HrpA-like RNA helicase
LHTYFNELHVQAREFKQAEIPLPPMEILPIYGGLSAEKQMQVLRPR